MNHFHTNNVRNKNEWEAVDWLLAKQSSQWSETDEMDFLEWCGNEDNFSAYQEIQYTWDTLDDCFVPSKVAIKPKTKHRNWMLSAAAIAATIALVFLFQFNTIDNNQPLRLTTSIGQQKTHELIDGSIILLNTNSDISVLYMDHQRQITLNRGEALFTVAKNPNKPFIVSAGKTSTQAIGTQFSVYRKKDGNIRIAVVEGIVQVTDSNQSNNINSLFVPRLVENETLTISPNLSTLGKKKANISSMLSWQEGVLDFYETPLENVIKEVNRYGRKKIIITDNHVKSLEISGVFKISDLDTFASTIENILPINVVEAENNKLYLQKELP